MKWGKFDIAGTNYLNTMTNTNDPSQERNETNQLEDTNPKLNQENPEDELHGDLNQLRILSDKLKNTREPSRVSLATSLQNIVESINIAGSEITSLSEYRARMREHYSTSIQRGYKKPEFHKIPTMEQIYRSKNKTTSRCEEEASLHGLV